VDEVVPDRDPRAEQLYAEYLAERRKETTDE